MPRVLLAVLALFGVSTVAGCAGPWSRTVCTRGWTVGHPTMTTNEISLGPDARVRQVSEGAKGNLGAGYATEIDLE